MFRGCLLIDTHREWFGWLSRPVFYLLFSFLFLPDVGIRFKVHAYEATKGFFPCQSVQEGMKIKGTVCTQRDCQLVRTLTEKLETRLR